MLKKKVLSATTDSDGDATVIVGGVYGKLFAVYWNKDGAATGVDVALTSEGLFSKSLLTLTDANSSALYYPRDLVHDATGSALTGTSGGDREMPLVHGSLQLVIDEGGATKTCSVTCWIEV